MGQQVSHVIPPQHVQIYHKVNAIQNPATKLHMIETLLSDPSIVQSAKVAGVYAHFLSAAASLRHAPVAPAAPVAVATQSQHTRPTHYPAHTPQIANTQHTAHSTHSTQLAIHAKTNEDMYTHVAKSKRAEKALNYFTTCLRVLGIEEEVALTEEFLTKAYKRAAIKTHPDKGGSKEAFDAVTRAYAYLGDILTLTRGKKPRMNEDAPVGKSYEDMQRTRTQDTETYRHVEPVRLNPNNLNMQVFNQMFEQTRVPDPDEDGYGDWLKGGEAGGMKGGKGGKKFSEDFNREVFNRMFEDETRREGSTSLTVFSPQELILAPTAGVELGRDRPPDYTAAANASLKYTDLRAAYTHENTIADKLNGSQVHNRSFEQVRADREKAPAVYNQAELEALRSYEQQKERAEQARRLRAAQEQVSANDYFERMKQLVITDGSAQGQQAKNLIQYQR